MPKLTNQRIEIRKSVLQDWITMIDLDDTIDSRNMGHYSEEEYFIALKEQQRIVKILKRELAKTNSL